jgi:hypothetical protein
LTRIARIFTNFLAADERGLKSGRRKAAKRKQRSTGEKLNNKDAKAQRGKAATKRGWRIADGGWKPLGARQADVEQLTAFAA